MGNGATDMQSIPRARHDRQRLRTWARETLAARPLVPPVSLAELRQVAADVLATRGGHDEHIDYLALLLNNQVWLPALAETPVDERLLVLPSCLQHPRDGEPCPEPCTCELPEVGRRARAQGCQVAVLTDLPQLRRLLADGDVRATIGISTLDHLYRIQPVVENAAIPALALPLLEGDSEGRTVDLDWLQEALEVTGGQDRALRPSYLRREIEVWFTWDRLVELMGAPKTETEAIGMAWLATAGKRWRPFLAACVYHSLQTDPTAPAPRGFRQAALAVECFHKASLVHDDIEDEDDFRYGEPTLHKRYGLPVALNAGDYLIGEGYRLLAECPDAAKTRADMLAAAASGHRMLSLGQGAELCWARRPQPLSSAEVLEIFRRKTAPAFGVALQVGAIQAGADSEVREALARYSEALGIAYQIQDDLKDYCGREDSNDSEAMRPSVILALAWERSGGSAHELLESLWRREVPYARVAPKVDLVFRELELEQAALELLDEYRCEALEALRPLAQPPLKRLLRQVMGMIFGELDLRQVTAN